MSSNLMIWSDLQSRRWWLQNFMFCRSFVIYWVVVKESAFIEGKAVKAVYQQMIRSSTAPHICTLLSKISLQSPCALRGQLSNIGGRFLVLICWFASECAIPRLPPLRLPTIRPFHLVCPTNGLIPNWYIWQTVWNHLAWWTNSMPNNWSHSGKVLWIIHGQCT